MEELAKRKAKVIYDDIKSPKNQAKIRPKTPKENLTKKYLILVSFFAYYIFI